MIAEKLARIAFHPYQEEFSEKEQGVGNEIRKISHIEERIAEFLGIYTREEMFKAKMDLGNKKHSSCFTMFDTPLSAFSNNDHSLMFFCTNKRRIWFADKLKKIKIAAAVGLLAGAAAVGKKGYDNHEKYGAVIPYEVQINHLPEKE
jgi:hypothetical protein